VSAITSRILTAVAGVLLGLGAVVLACQALTAALVSWLGLIGGLLTGAVVLAALGALAFWAVLRRDPEVEEEVEEVKSAAADMLAGLPGDAIMALIRKHPTVVLVAALMLGLTLVRDPAKAMRQVQNMVLALL
jgi:hypothetical protein